MAIASGNASLSVSTNFTIDKTNSGGALKPTNAQQSYGSSCEFQSIGAGAGAFSEVYSAVRTLAGAADETLDLYGSLVNQLGDTINFARVKVILIELLDTTTASSITIGAAATNPFEGPLGGTDPTETVTNGGFWANGRSDATGWAVTNGSNDNLKIVNDDATHTATYRITLYGSIT